MISFRPFRLSLLLLLAPLAGLCFLPTSPTDGGPPRTRTVRLGLLIPADLDDPEGQVELFTQAMRGLRVSGDPTEQGMDSWIYPEIGECHEDRFIGEWMGPYESQCVFPGGTLTAETYAWNFPLWEGLRANFRFGPGSDADVEAIWMGMHPDYHIFYQVCGPEDLPTHLMVIVTGTIREPPDRGPR